MQLPRTLSLDEAAAFLRIHKETLKVRARAKLIPGAKIGRSWAFLEADLEMVMVYAHHSAGFIAGFANNNRRKK